MKNNNKRAVLLFYWVPVNVSKAEFHSASTDGGEGGGLSMWGCQIIIRKA
jgi:hypothetical protein